MTLFDPPDDAVVDPGAYGHPPTEPSTPPSPADPPARVRLRLTVAYDGSGFHGFAAQPGQRTVAGELTRALSRTLRQPVELTCAGRTDTGVHASGQVVHADVVGPVDTAAVVKAANAQLGPAIVVREAALAPDGFDARRSARARRYRYLVLEAATGDPLLAPLAWHVRDRLDLRAMANGADGLLGEHDFRAFCRRAPGAAADAPIVRRVLDARWREVAWSGGGLAAGSRLLRFDIVATSFCHQMVRSVVGTLADVGRGRRRAADVVFMLRSGDRSRGVTLAPPHGLCLLAVDYGPDDPGP